MNRYVNGFGLTGTDLRILKMARPVAFFLAALLWISPVMAFAQGEIIEIVCQSGERQRLAQGSTASEEARNVQQIIVVCERTAQIRTIKIPIDPARPVQGEPLLAHQYGNARSELLGVSLPKFLVPGNTCPLFPISAYLEHNICPTDGTPGIQATVVGYF
jgi:hypothetical protein